MAGRRRTDLIGLLAVLGDLLGVEPGPVHTCPRPGDVGTSEGEVSEAARGGGLGAHRPPRRGPGRPVEWFAAAPTRG